MNHRFDIPLPDESILFGYARMVGQSLIIDNLFQEVLLTPDKEGPVMVTRLDSLIPAITRAEWPFIELYEIISVCVQIATPPSPPKEANEPKYDQG